ncbi:ABC transporter permease [Pectobacterium sp. B1J-3]|uniref:ABC transporter permease n=1 Tax=Pectobacterium sp. B1J-3 TaxID=3385371 RepID=UPI003905F254
MISGVWRVSSGLLAGLLLLPLATVFLQSFFMTSDQPMTYWQTGLPVSLLHSAVTVTGTVLISLIIGLPAAWLMAMYRFPGQRMLRWGLCLPLAMPAFLLAYLYADVLTFISPFVDPIVKPWRDSSFWPPELMVSLSGACIVLAFVLYPYIYLLVHHALVRQPASLINAARLLKHSRSQVIWRLCLPIARPAIVTGAILVAVEALGDYGTASYLAISTLMTSVLDIGQQGDLITAARIAVVMLPIIFLLVFLASIWRRKQQVYQAYFQSAPMTVPLLTGWRSGLAQCYCWTLVSLTFIFPLLYLIFEAAVNVMPSLDMAFLHAMGNSLLTSVLATLLITLMSLLFIFYTRTAGAFANPLPVKLVNLSYAIPGAILGIGLFIPLSLIDRYIGLFATNHGFTAPEIVLSTSLFILVLAYCVKFGRLMLDGLEHHMAKIPVSLDQATLLLKCSVGQRWTRVHIPLLRHSLLFGALLIFTEGMKELNASLLLRPFHLETLATHVFRLVSEDQMASLALPALILVVIGIAPIVGLSRILNIKG